jgi:hypothetical protein
MSSAVRRVGLITVVCVCLVHAGAAAQVGNLRITEIDPATGEVEVSNAGPAFTTPTSYPFCHRFNYQTTVTSGLFFATGGIHVISVSGLNGADSDIWLYSNSSFANPASVVHGLKYGSQPNVGRVGVASTAGLWPGASAYVNTPPAGMTLSWDGFGFDPLDWYIDETPSLGNIDVTTAGTVPFHLQYPFGTQDFEDMKLGDEFMAIAEWSGIDQSLPGYFTARAVNDVLGVIAPREGSTQWLRIRDQDGADVQNRVYGPLVVGPPFDNPDGTPNVTHYKWTYWINLQQMPPTGGGTQPRLTIQHVAPGFENMWGLRFDPGSVKLFVNPLGGGPSEAELFTIAGATDVGEWIKVELYVHFFDLVISATVNDGTPVELPISPDPIVDRKQFRICYRGEGPGNVMTLLLDDINVVVDGPAVPVAFQNFTAETDDHGVTLRWDVFADEPVSGFRVYRRICQRRRANSLTKTSSTGVSIVTSWRFDCPMAEKYGRRHRPSGYLHPFSRSGRISRTHSIHRRRSSTPSRSP